METAVHKTEHYDGLNGLRALASIGIVLMHVLANGSYELHGFLFEQMIPSFANFVYLFMIVSGFSMCCGYYEKVSTGSITPVQFYSKRFAKILPFFALLNLLDFVVSPSLASVYEIFANLTLCFGLLPNPSISVIGVGWTLGVIFVFYLLFPFFCFLISSKKRAWFTFAAALIYNALCRIYFFNADHMPEVYSGRTNILYCGIYFVTGGLIYCYRSQLAHWSKKLRWVLSVLAIVAFVYYSLSNKSTYLSLFVYSLMLLCALGSREVRSILNNRATSFLSQISMEIYLCHMVVYRVLDKVKITDCISSGILKYLITFVLTFGGSVAFALCAQFVLRKSKAWVSTQFCKYASRSVKQS